MPEQKRKMIDYMVACVNEFAQKKELNPKDAYMYLFEYKGIDFLQEYYDIEHTLSFEDAVEDLDFICKKNGGCL